MSIDREAWLQVCAYHIWQSEGCPDGRDVAHWASAERVFADVAAAPEAASTAKGRARSVKVAVTEAAAKAAKPAARRKKPAAPAAAPSL